ncbi:MAG: hypothetical protein JOZ07_13585 [Solirubrobacterales bacterium]|nr:hypothetical protein [Solirubrobacterales bacterium]
MTAPPSPSPPEGSPRVLPHLINDGVELRRRRARARARAAGTAIVSPPATRAPGNRLDRAADAEAHQRCSARPVAERRLGPERAPGGSRTR